MTREVGHRAEAEKESNGYLTYSKSHVDLMQRQEKHYSDLGLYYNNVLWGRMLESDYWQMKIAREPKERYGHPWIAVLLCKILTQFEH